MSFPSFARPLAAPNRNRALGNPDQATPDPANYDHYLIDRDKLAASYSETHRWPNWVSWFLTKADFGSVPRDPNFEPDRDLPAGYVEVVSSDYDHSGYDRGHMEPSADETDTLADNEELFRLSNCVPQLHALNAGPWEKLEAWCRARAEEGSDLFITCGPIAPPAGMPVRKIGRDQVSIPAACWKIVVVVPAGAGSAVDRLSVTCPVIAVRMPNDASVSLRDDWNQYRTTVAAIEAETGYTFFDQVPPAITAAWRSRLAIAS